MFNKKIIKKYLTIISGTALALSLVLGWLGLPQNIKIILYSVSILSGGYFVVVPAIQGLFKQRFLNIDFLVTLAAFGAIYINQYAEAAAVIFFFTLAEMFEEYGVERSHRAIKALIKKSPQTAILANGKKLPVEKIKIKDIVIVRPGDLIPLDGLVVKGESSVDEAAITGESVPKDKQKNDQVFAGTINQNGYMEIKVSKISKDSTFAKIIELVEKAQASRAPAQEFIDRFAKYYTPAIVVIAIFIAIIPPLFFNGNFTDWLYNALVLLVISCPCALVISTPVSVASAIGGASRKGILIKGGKYLEALGKIKQIAFDKTKTLTFGQPLVSDVITFNGFSEEDVLADAAGLEKFSSHPLAKSILDFAQKRGITPHIMEKYENIVGKGGKANCIICDDAKHYIGNLKLIKANSATTATILTKIEKMEQEGKTVVLISKNKQIMGALAISDTIRPEAKKMILKLKTLKIKALMLTGDNLHTAKFIADKVGIKKVFASLLPAEKLQKITELKKQNNSVAMVGDGVNDAPSLAAADVGIAMGAGGSDVAIETANVALMNNNLLNIPYTINLGKKTSQTIKQNIVASLGVKAIFLILALFGFAHLELAIATDSGIAILVILNSLRLFNLKEY